MRHELIKTDNYLLVVDDSEIKEGDLCIADGATYNNTIVKYMKSPCPPPYVSNLSILKKIIAHLPLNNSPILEGVPLLPPLPVDNAWNHGLEKKLAELPYTKHLDDGQYNDGKVTGFEFGANWGFDKAKEKYKYTEEDIQRAFTHCAKYAAECMSSGVRVDFLSRLEMYLESLSQPKLPVAIDVEMETPADSFTSFVGNIVGQGTLPKTITNSQGQIQLVGKYIYEGGENE